ncbi:MAG TPA: heme-dependent peroxidase [Planctomycetaceae bacterium]|nr:heme-dependent peroxidase [Planctomycetaceae bacterium]
MSGRPPMPSTPQEEPSIKLHEGWHCLQVYYQVNQRELKNLSKKQCRRGIQQVIEILNPERAGVPERMQVFATSGHRADLGLMLMDPDPLVIDTICQELRSSELGTVLQPTYSFVSLTEISEYVPTLEQFSEKLIREGANPEDDMFKARVRGYEQRLPAMNKQRIYPEIPPYPVHCFYPMNKIRDPHANWFDLPFSARSELMAEHATSGIKFAGKVSQLITASTGFDDWEWGVTLWARNPIHVKDIVYTMRFDKASARYAEFGPFYIGYVMSAAEVLKHVRIDA